MALPSFLLRFLSKSSIVDSFKIALFLLYFQKSVLCSTSTVTFLEIIAFVYKNKKGKFRISARDRNTLNMIQVFVFIAWFAVTESIQSLTEDGSGRSAGLEVTAEAAASQNAKTSELAFEMRGCE